LANTIYSQIEAHQEYGGVFPNVAIREHKKNITKTLLEALKKANLLEVKKEIADEKKKMEKIKEILKDKGGKGDNLLFQDFQQITKYQRPKIDYLSVTIGPGLEPCLWVGVNFVKALSICWDIPVIPVNHIEGHILANWLAPISENYKSQITNHKNLFPAICLVVSGGHTQLILMEKIGEYEIIGETRDDAAGECFDKIAKILGLGYPGGPAIAQQAEQWKPQITNHPIRDNGCLWQPISNGAGKFKINLPRPMKYQKNYDFSFSGLKTAVFYDFKSRPPEVQKDEEYIREICYRTQEAIIDLLLYKTFKAAEKYNVKTIILGGGVSANNRLRSEIKKEAKLKNLTSFIPEKKLSVDNGVMVATAAYFSQEKATREIKKIKADPNLRLKNN